MARFADRTPPLPPPHSSTRRLVLGIVCVWLVSGCGRSTIRPVDDTKRKTWLASLEDGRTMRAEVEAQLGTHGQRSFQGGRIVTYQLVRQYDRFYAVPHEAATGAKYELVLVFDDRDVLVRHNLLRIR